MRLTDNSWSCGIFSYEGTGRSLSLKLIQQLREQGNKLLSNGSVDGGPVSGIN
jgi:tRNA(Met) C34 N-acetyltransferase TmcA